MLVRAHHLLDRHYTSDTLRRLPYGTPNAEKDADAQNRDSMAWSNGLAIIPYAMGSITVEKGQMVCLIGASGAGKSTLLRCINLLEPIEDGAIFLDGEDISIPGLNPQRVRAKIGMVFQNFNLFPHMTAFENTMLAPKRVQGLSKSQLKSEIEELFERF